MMWQIAGGEAGVLDYSQVFLDYDVMLLAPGHFGPFSLDDIGLYTKHDGGQIQAFVGEPKAGDVVLLRIGSNVKAVGVIPEEDTSYLFLNQFKDVLGWDARHVRRVLWVDPVKSPLAESIVFRNSQQRAFGHVKVPRLNGLESQLPKDSNRPLKPLPSSFGESLSSEELGIRLFQEGLSNEAVDRVVSTIAKIVRLNSWYRANGQSGRPTEHEVIAHMIIPLMLGMGWSEQLMAVEWQQMDMAFFGSTPVAGREPLQECRMILEAKSPSGSLQKAYEQAQQYVESKRLRNCQRIATTNGIILFLYQRTGDVWPVTPTGYVNLSHICDKNIFPHDTSGVDTLIQLVPWKALAS